MMDAHEFYRMINTILFKVHERFPRSALPKEEVLVSDYHYRNQIREVVNKIAALTTSYSPSFEFQTSPFNKEKIVPVIPVFQADKMWIYRKQFDAKSVLKAFDL